jgi:glyoxylase I family protein
VPDAEEPAACAPITGLSHVQLMVTDLRRSADWYSTVLSLEPFAQDLELGYVALRQPHARMVVVLTERGVDDGRPVASSGDALDHIAFSVSDGDALRTWATHLSDLGIEHAGVVLENGRPSLQLRDPDGIAIELVA